MPGLPPCSFELALADQSGPALVLDAGAAVLLAANADAARLLAVGGHGLALPLQLDAAMPAIGRLRQLLRQASPAAGRLTAELTFWTSRGPQAWTSEVMALSGDATGRILVRRLPDGGADKQPLAPSISPGRELRHLAHELRTPLAAVLSLADVMLGGYLGPVANPRHLDYLGSIRETARHALGVIESMLVRPLEGGRGRSADAGLDLDAVVAEIAAAMSALAVRSGARLVARTGGVLTMVAADATALRQMLLNLVANSLAHAGGGITVTMTTGVQPGGLVWVEVADNGPGIPEAVIDRLAIGGSPSTQERPEIGLLLTQALAEAQGGRLELASGPDGARARLVLPAHQSPGAAQVVASSSG